jgi:hypothetical protein
LRSGAQGLGLVNIETACLGIVYGQHGRRIRNLQGACPNPLLRNGGLSAEEELAQEIREMAQANEVTTSVSKGQ